MADLKSLVLAKKSGKVLKAPQWSEYLKFAWPPLNWSGEKLPDVAVYDLEHQPTTYDFVCFLMIVKTLGARSVHFAYEGKIQSWKYPESQAWKRFSNILIPLCDMMKMPYTIGPKRRGFTSAYRWGHVDELFRALGAIEKIPTPEVEKKNYITITVRDTIKFKWKDSNRKAWGKFAEFLKSTGEKVVFIDDSDSTGLIMEPQKRMELYAGAKLNMGGSGGPMSLCLFSDLPYLVMNLIPDSPESSELKKEFENIGFPEGSRFSFANYGQVLDWRPDTYENIMDAYLNYWKTR